MPPRRRSPDTRGRFGRYPPLWEDRGRLGLARTCHINLPFEFYLSFSVEIVITPSEDPKSQLIGPKSRHDGIKEEPSRPTPSFNPPPPSREAINELPGLESLQPLQKELELINAKLSSRIDDIERASNEAAQDLRVELESMILANSQAKEESGVLRSSLESVTSNLAESVSTLSNHEQKFDSLDVNRGRM